MQKWNREISFVSRYNVIVHCVNDDLWQDFRLSLKGISTEEKLSMLESWIQTAADEQIAKMQVDNYLGALKRGGQIDSEGNVLK